MSFGEGLSEAVEAAVQTLIEHLRCSHLDSTSLTSEARDPLFPISLEWAA